MLPRERRALLFLHELLLTIESTLPDEEVHQRFPHNKFLKGATRQQHFVLFAATHTLATSLEITEIMYDGFLALYLKYNMYLFI